MTILFLVLVLLATWVVMLPAYGIVAFTIADQADEYSKATVGYGANVPSTVEGGSPLFIYISLIPMVVVFVSGIAAAVAIAVRRPASGRLALITIASMGAAIAIFYIVVQLAVGPTWPPPTSAGR